MTIAQHITDLLYRYECVILPNFGAFITQTESARVHSTTHAFYPPRKVVSFNGQLTKSDGLLIHHIATVEQSNYYSASSKIDSFVRTLRSNLKQQGSIQFDALGQFTLLEHDKLSFEPSNTTNFLASSFGLSTFTAETVVREAVTAHFATSKTVTKTSKDAQPVVVLPQQNTQRPYLKYAAIGIITIGIAGLLGLNHYSNKVVAHNIVEQQKANNQLENKIQEATFIIDSPLKPIAITIEKPIGKYHIVAGAFRVESNVDKKIAQLETLGFNAYRIGKNKYGLHQVAYSNHNNRQEAIKTLRKIQRTQNRSAWLLVQDLD